VDAVQNGKRTNIEHLLLYICVDPTPGFESGADQYFWTTLKLCRIISSSHHNKLTTTVTTMPVFNSATASKRTFDPENALRNFKLLRVGLKYVDGLNTNTRVLKYILLLSAT
jgi:hypothetical protein